MQLPLKVSPHDRATLNELLHHVQKTSLTELFKTAFNLYLLLHQYIREGFEIVLRTTDQDREKRVSIPLQWNPAAALDPVTIRTEIENRQSLEIEVDSEQAPHLDFLIHYGASPSLEALAGWSCEILSQVVQNLKRNWVLIAKKTEKEILINWSSKPPKPESQRLILNFTVQERERLKQLYLESHSSSESDFARRAIELYADLHQRVSVGSQIVLVHNKEIPIYVPVPKQWNYEAAPMPKRKSRRRNFELKIKGSLMKRVNHLVEAGAAPSYTRLAWVALGTYAMITEAKVKGGRLMEEKDGRHIPIIEPS